jgi:hypothetical protein
VETATHSLVARIEDFADVLPYINDTVVLSSAMAPTADVQVRSWPGSRWPMPKPRRRP